MIYLYGLRVGEVALLTCDDVDLAGNKITIRRVKGGNWSERPLFATVRRQLADHLATIPHERDAPLFPGRRGPLRKRQVQSLFTRYRDRAGLDPRFSTHGLRHAIATHLLDAGVSLDFIQEHLGHRSIDSTVIYARLTGHRRRAVFASLEQSEWIVHPGSAAHPTDVGSPRPQPHEEPLP